MISIYKPECIVNSVQSFVSMKVHTIFVIAVL